MDASYKIQRGIHVHLIQFFMCPEFWVHITLTSHTDFAAFLEAVQQCRGEVLFCTREGDKLNLKSTLSKYLFAALAGNEELLRKGKIVCQFPQDEEKLTHILSASM